MQKDTTFDINLVKVKRAGHDGIIQLDNGNEYEVAKLNHSTEGFVTFTSVCGKYVRHSGSYTYYSLSRDKYVG